MNQNTEQSIDFKKYIGLAISYSWLIILLPTIGGVGAYFYSKQHPEIYQTHATLLVEQRRAGYSAGVSDYGISAQLAKTYARLITAGPFLQKVSERENLERLGQISTRTQENPPLLEIHIRDTNPNLVAKSANAIALNFIDHVIEQRLTEIAKLQAAASAQGITDIQSIVCLLYTSAAADE